jgi:ribosomal protein S13
LKKIIQYCDDHKIKYAIRAKTSASLRAQIEALAESDWQSMRNKKDEPVNGQDTTRIAHWIGDYEKPFTLVIQRKRMHGQVDLETNEER